MRRRLIASWLPATTPAPPALEFRQDVVLDFVRSRLGRNRRLYGPRSIGCRGRRGGTRAHGVNGTMPSGWTRIRWLLLLPVAACAVAALVVLYRVDPSQSTRYPKCAVPLAHRAALPGVRVDPGPARFAARPTARSAAVQCLADRRCSVRAAVRVVASALRYRARQDGLVERRHRAGRRGLWHCPKYPLPSVRTACAAQRRYPATKRDRRIQSAGSKPDGGTGVVVSARSPAG